MQRTHCSNDSFYIFRTNIASHLVLDFVEEVIGGVFLESSLNIHGTDFWSYALFLDAVITSQNIW